MVGIIYLSKDNKYLNITSRCSNDCIFCLRQYDNLYRRMLMMDYKEEPSVEKVLEEMGRSSVSGINSIVFCGIGEPLLRLEDVLKISRGLKKYKKIIRIDTNGQVYSWEPRREVPRWLKEAGVDEVSISLNATNKNDYARICKPKYSEGVYPLIIDFIGDCIKEGLKTIVSFVKLTEDFPNLKECEDLANKLGAKFKLRHYSGPSLEEFLY